MKNITNATLTSAFLLSLSAHATTTLAEGVFSLTSGVDYSTGKYGQSQSTDITYIPLVTKYETDATTVKLTVPWVQITGPGDVVGADAILVRGNSSQKKRTESGLGDVVFTATHTIANIGENRPLILDLAGKIKFATASRTKGLGTGENDYAIGLDAYKPIGRLTTLFGGQAIKKWEILQASI